MENPPPIPKFKLNSILNFIRVKNEKLRPFLPVINFSILIILLLHFVIAATGPDDISYIIGEVEELKEEVESIDSSVVSLESRVDDLEIR